MSTYDGGPVEALWEACQTCVAERDAARADAERLAAACRPFSETVWEVFVAEDGHNSVRGRDIADIAAALAAHDALLGDAG